MKTAPADIAIFFQATNTALMFYDVDMQDVDDALDGGYFLSLQDEDGNYVRINPKLIQFVRVKYRK